MVWDTSGILCLSLVLRLGWSIWLRTHIPFFLLVSYSLVIISLIRITYMPVLPILCCSTTYGCVAVSDFVCGWSPLRWVKTFNSPSQIYRFHPNRNSWMKKQRDSAYALLPDCGVGKASVAAKSNGDDKISVTSSGDEKRSKASMHCIYSITLASFKKTARHSTL